MWQKPSPTTPAVILVGRTNPTPRQAARAWRIVSEYWLANPGIITEKAS
jgi:hypothetical protein